MIENRSTPFTPLSGMVLLPLVVLRLLLAVAAGAGVARTHGGEANVPATTPAEDRVLFPKDYESKFVVVRKVERRKEGKVVAVYANSPAASVTDPAKLPYPNGSVIVMETAMARVRENGEFALDPDGTLARGLVLGMHVMRREKDFGQGYGDKRSGEWEFVEYRPDGAYITPPEKSGACAACHIKAGAAKDFVYAARFPEKPKE